MSKIWFLVIYSYDLPEEYSQNFIDDLFKTCYSNCDGTLHTKKYEATLQYMDAIQIVDKINKIGMKQHLIYTKTSEEMGINIDEQAYIDLMSSVLNTGIDKPNRTGTDTKSITGSTLRFSLTKNGNKVLPLVTTKFTSFRLVATELLWFLKGDTSVKSLTDQNNHIWDANGSRKFLDSRGFKFRLEGDLGPVYGWQWRNWNAKYIDIDNRSPDYKPGGIDQIKLVIDSIKNDPWSRRHIVSAWNPEQIDDMALPPCHSFFQFIVRPSLEKNKLDCILYQRSADLPLGVPFNIASYSLLTHMIAHVCGLKAGTLVHNMGDVHIYHNQIPGCNEQIKRTPFDFPTLEFSDAPDNIENWNMDNFVVKNYKKYKSIKFPFST